MGATTRRRLAQLSIVAGLALLALSASWLVWPAPSGGAPAAPGLAGPSAPPSPELAAVRSVDALAALVREGGGATPRDVAERATALVGARFEPCEPTAFGVRQNWILAAVGVVRPLQATHTSRHLIAYARCGGCGQVNGTLVRVLERLGIPARLFNVPGHVVAEASWNGRWHLVDAHFGFFPAPDEEHVDAEALTRDPQLVRAVYGERVSPILLASLVRAFERHRPGDPAFGPRARGADVSPRLAALHRVLEAAKWLVPAAMIAAGSLALRRAPSWR
ncbi:MAG: hypothetical protein DCC71_20045 [Proteobacteria bacterium]|nr:MAG: hypothetical protein DCC71_20045 [Pseudomonadota bacterium]